MLGYRVGRVRVVFTLPEKAHKLMFQPHVENIPKHLAYIEWFSPFEDEPDPNHLLYKIKATRSEEGHVCSVISVNDIRRSAHPYPKLGASALLEWKSSTVLDQCNTFYLNSFNDRNLYRIAI